ncbi:SARP family transcriptional regulator [Actinoplanes sp. NBRC 14428]|nr:SARP family transcriptional regulator [Actinoplanes sp. NBRC 14428]
MELQILGPLRASVADRDIPLGGRRNRAILGVLALEANRLVPTERLLDAVWEGRAPSTARSQVQICVSALRRSFTEADAPDVIRTQAPGYLLRTAPGQLDAAVFDDLVIRAGLLVENGHDADAATELRRALALWRGPALGGLLGRMLEAGARRLEERRLAATEECLRLELALGRHATVIDELRALVDEHPLRETLHCHLMLALYRAGRQAEALQAYRSARGILVDEFGIEPSAELRHLERDILRGSVAPGPAAPRRRPAAPPGGRPPIPRQLPAGVADLTGRQEAVAELTRLLSAPAPGLSVPVIAVTGTGGVGKTVLAVHVAHQLSDMFPDGQLFVNLGGATPAADPSEVLRRFLRALGVPDAAVPDGLDQRAEIYRSLLADRRVLVVLDDVAEETQLPALMPGSASCRVLVTARSRLPGLPGAHRVEVGMLHRAEAVQLLARIAGADRVRADPATADEIAGLCGGLPLAVRVAGARLAARPHWPLARLADRLAGEAGRLDELEHGATSVRATLGSSLQGVRPEDRRLLSRLALLEVPSLAAWMGTAVLGAGATDLEESLERLVEAQLLEVCPEDRAMVRYRVPELVRVFARERTVRERPAAEIEELHRRFAGVLLGLAEEAYRRQYGGDRVLSPGTAPRPALPPRWVDDLLATPGAWLDAERMTLVSAVRQTAALDWDEVCWELALAAAAGFEARGLVDLWTRSAMAAAECVQRTGNVRGTAAMDCSIGAALLWQGRFTEAAERLDGARAGFERCADGHGEALALRLLAHADRVAGRARLARRRYDRALKGFRTPPNPAGQSQVLTDIAALLPGEQAAHLLSEALTISRMTGARRPEARALHGAGEAALRDGEPEAAVKAFVRSLRVARHVGDRYGETQAVLGLGLADLLAGRHEPARTRVSAALDAAREIGARLLEGHALLALSRVDAAQGRTTLAGRRLAKAGEILGPAQEAVPAAGEVPAPVSHPSWSRPGPRAARSA